MRKLALSLIVAFAFYVTAAAQSGGTSPSSQGTQGSSPSMQQPGQQPGTAQPGTPSQYPDTTNSQTGSTAGNANTNTGEKKLKGCVESQNGQYVLMTKKGNVALAGQDVSAHVGHEVQLKGTWENSGSNANPSATPSSSGSGSEAWSKGTFNVTDVKMESEACKMKSKDSGSMGHGNSGRSGTSGTSGSSTGSGTGSESGSTSAPPQ